ncbi:MAG: radical SAM family heme chaperone HemW [Bacilli bacterium]|nr:radical SAM family heme chaperone HemW [Bacilli bacterium]
MVKSVYVHIPFCKNICSYCDFCKFYYNRDWINKYLNSLKKEIEDNYNNEIINTIYIGGGTPSSLSLEELKKLFSIINIFKLNKKYEFTIEFNIEDITKEKLELCKDNKVNRISIGVESFNKNNLKFLGRNTNININEKINLVKEFFTNINIDLIYALPNQSINDLETDLDNFIKLDIPHISCYSLILEEHTKLHNMNIKPISEDLDFDMYNLINNKLKMYNHYEISNYSKKGYESRANLTYWNNEEYYGFGVGASGYIDNIRYNNSKNIINYMNMIYKKEEEFVSIEDKISYELILGFRKVNGINIKDFKKKYNKDILDLYNIKELVNNKMLEIANDYIFINNEYLYMSNEILVNFI